MALPNDGKVGKGKTVGVIWGRHGLNEQGLTDDKKTGIILLDETDTSLKAVPGAREYPDTVLHHELLHHNNPKLSEPRIRILENKYRDERKKMGAKIGPRRIYQNLPIGLY